MNRRGSIALILILMMTFVLSACMYMIYLVRIQSHIVSNSEKSVQARIMVDGDIHRVLYDKTRFEDLLLPEIYKILRNRLPPYSFKDSDKDGVPDGQTIKVDMDSIQSLNLRLEASKEVMGKNYKSHENFADDTSIIMRFKTDFQGRKGMVEVKAKIINSLFEIEESYIDDFLILGNNLSDSFNTLMDTFEKDIFDFDPKGSSLVEQINLDENARIDDRYIVNDCGNIIKTYNCSNSYLLLNIKSREEKVVIELRNNNVEKLTIKGNIYCEGDLIVSTPFELQGNLILNNGSLIVNTDIKPIFKGKIFHRGNGDVDREKIQLLSEKRYIYRYGSYLPGFLDFQVYVIKS